MLDTQSLLQLSKGISRFSECLYGDPSNISLLQSFRDAMTFPQMASKIELLKVVQENDLNVSKAFFIGHWHGLLPFLFFSDQITRVGVGIELSPLWQDISERLCREFSWNSFVGDALLLNPDYYFQQNFDAVINCSCEHMENRWLNAIPQGTLVIAQSNNYEIPEHLFPQQSLQHFREYLNLSSEELSYQQDFGIYTRFTIIGRK